MKGKVKLLSDKPTNHYLQVDDSDYPPQPQQRANVRPERRFFTSKHEEIDKQDNVSACLSIEKELPELSIRPNQNHSFDQNVAIRNLMNENKLKEEALVKASKVIGLMQEENAELNAKIQQLEILVSERDSLIESLENELRLNTSQDKNLSKDVLTERNRHTVHVDFSKSQNRTPREEKVKSKSELFFDFTHSKEKQNGVRKSQNKIFVGDNPTFKEIKDINISKKLTPYTSKNMVKNATENAENTISTNLTEQLALLVLQEQIENNRYLTEQLGELISLEMEDYLQFENELQKMQRDLLEEQEEQSISRSYVKSISKNITEVHALSVEQSSKKSIIEEYEKLIYEYREYAAFLKSYLCESLNFIHSISTSYNQPLPSVNLVGSLKKAAKQLARKVNDKSKGLIEENRQLKSIIQQLIKNIELTRKKQISVRSWNEFELPLNTFQ